MREHAVPTRPLGLLLKRIHEFEENHQTDGRPLRIVIAGGGAAGVELAFAMHSRWGKRFTPVQITLVESQSALLTGHRPRVVAIIGRYLEEKGIACLTGLRVTGVNETGVHFEDHPSLPSDFLLWATGGAPPGLLKVTNLETSGAGFIRVRPTLQAMGYDNVFAAGDCIEFPSHSLPKSGVYAVREGPVLARNLHAWLKNRSLVPYRPQGSALALLMTGTRNAVASRRHVSFHGPWVWRLKDWIDRRWMRKFDPALLPPMDLSGDAPIAREAPSTNDAPPVGVKAGGVPEVSAMRCAGCGAKVGSSVLTGVLDELEVFDREDVRIGLHDADDAALLEIPLRPVAGTDRGRLPRLYRRPAPLRPHRPRPRRIRSVRHGGRTPLRTGYGHAALRGKTPRGKRPETAHGRHRGRSPRPRGHPPRRAYERGNGDGGQRNHERPGRQRRRIQEGRTASRRRARAVQARRHGRHPGGRHAPQGPRSWVDEVFEGMLRSNAEAARILAQAGIPSVTDVTGFGLAGHLVEMLEASGMGAELEIDRIPLYTGAADCVAGGVESTLAPSNREHLQKRWQVESGSGAADAAKPGAVDGRDALLFDPQTSGGLLAGVPPSEIDDVIAKLRAAGYVRAACIGRVTDRKRHLRIR